MITFGMRFGGPEYSEPLPIKSALLTASQMASSVREPDYDDGTEAWINPIFVVPGSVSQPDFEGIRLGHFSKKEKGLVVEIAVPQSVVHGGDTYSFIICSLRDAVKLAAGYFTTKSISFSTLKAENLILAIQTKLINSALEN